MVGVDPVLAFILDDLVALAPFGLGVEMTLVVDGIVVVGTPIAEREYFRQLGERFRKTVEGSSTLFWKREYEAQHEYERGWDESRLMRLGHDREQMYEWFGEYTQDQVRQRVLSRPRDLLQSWGDATDLRRHQEQANELFGDQFDATRTFVHLRDATILDTAREPIHRLLWRGRLASVSAWSLEPPAVGHEKS